jgi:cytochrome P450
MFMMNSLIHYLHHPGASSSPIHELRQTHGPLYWDRGLKMWVCLGYEAAVTILRNKDACFGASRLQSDAELQARGLGKWIPFYDLLRPQMLFQDHSHRQLHNAMLKRFTAPAVQALHAQVAQLVDAQLAPFVRASRPEMDLIADFAGALPTQVSCLLLGLPQGDLKTYMRWNEAYEYVLASFSSLPGHDKAAILAVLQEEISYFRRLIAERHKRPGNDLVSDLVRALLPEQAALDESLPEVYTVAANCVMLLAGGYKTSTNLIASGLLWLLRKPPLRERLLNEPHLFPAFLSEVMRLSGSSQYVARQAMQDVGISGKHLCKGQNVLVLLAAANMDEHAFPDPGELRLDRPRGKSHLGFSQGSHHCLGAPYAESLARSAITAFLHAFPSYLLACCEEDLEWGDHPNVRCLRHMPVLLGISPTSAHENISWGEGPPRSALPNQIAVNP